MHPKKAIKGAEQARLAGGKGPGSEKHGTGGKGLGGGCEKTVLCYNLYIN